MKIAILNFSGNVGKTTIAAHLFAPRMPGATIYSIESINLGADADGLDVEKMKGKKYGALIDEIMARPEALVDVGASNVEDFILLMQQYHGSHEEFDLYVVPCTREKKVQADTVNTIRALQKIGIPRAKIRVVFNRVELDEDVEQEFAAIFGLAASEKSCTVKKTATIHTNEVYERMKSAGVFLGQVTEDKTDYKALLRAATDEAEKTRCIARIGMQRLAVTANRNLDDVYQAIIK